MINLKTAFCLLAAVSLVLTGATSAADAKTYRTVGKIIKVSGTTFLLRASAQDIEITYDAKTKMNGKLTYGAPATVNYIKVGGREYATEINIGSTSGAAAKDPAAQKKE